MINPLRLFRRHQFGPSAEACAAVSAAREQRLQAETALVQQRAKLPEAERVRSALREHNEANHFADWIIRVGLEAHPRRTP